VPPSCDRRSRFLATHNGAAGRRRATRLVLWWKVDDPGRSRAPKGTVAQASVAGGTLGGIWDGLRAGLGGASSKSRLGQTHTSTDGRRAQRDSTPCARATINHLLLGFLVLFVALTVIAWREFGAPYGPVRSAQPRLAAERPSSRWPLLSLPRFGVVVFPFFLALAWIGGRTRARTPRYSASAGSCSASSCAMGSVGLGRVETAAKPRVQRSASSRG
jgi:hypothetical protein